MLGLTILTQGPVPLFLYDSAVEADQKDRYLQISQLFLSGVAEVTRTWEYSCGRLLYSRALAWTYLIAIGLSLLSILLIFLMKEPEEREEKSFDHKKRILEVVKQEVAGKPVLFYWMFTYQLVGTIMCMFLFLLPTENQ